MNWSHSLQGLNDILTAILIVRLLALRLHNVYRVFCVFLFFQLLGSVITLYERVVHNPNLDYRVTWIPLKALEWVLALAVVYSLLKTMLAELPGILSFSRRLLNATFVLAIAVALWTAKAEYTASSGAFGYVGPLEHAVGITIILNRAICTAALLVLLGILCFILWFPVQMPRNLAVFSIGFVVYFTASTVFWLVWSLGSAESLRLTDNISIAVLSACYGTWIFFINKEGESAPVRLGHIWHTGEQERLISQLEAINASLLRAAARR